MAQDPLPRDLRDEATVGPPNRARTLQRLSELGSAVAAGEPDVRGWVVAASTGGEIGTVADLLVDAGEVVMLDVDLRSGGDHTYAPIRAAWIDDARHRVVLDARALAGAAVAPAATGTAGGDLAPGLPALPRSGPLSDADIARFDDAYVRLYGDRAADHDATWRVPRGSDDALEFAPRGPRDSAAVGAPGQIERRVNRIDDASDLDDDAAIDPRELDARVRIDEGATVDDEAPIAGVRYEGEEHTPHDYGTPDDAYGPGHGSGRIGFNKVVSRRPYAGAEGALDVDQANANTGDDASAARARPVRYRQYDDRYTGPDAAR